MIPVMPAPHKVGESVVFNGDPDKFQPLPAVVFPDGRVLTEWRLSEEELQQLVRGEAIRLWVWAGRQAMQAVLLEVTSEHV